MKKLALLFLIGFIIILVKNKPETTVSVNKNFNAPIPSISPSFKPQNTRYKIQNTSHSIFLPYWTLPDSIDQITTPKVEQLSYQVIDNYIFFGIAPDESGINTSEPGYTNLEKFSRLQFPENSQRTLTLRMTNTDINLSILDSQKFQDEIIAQTIALAKEHHFTAVLYDLELKALPTESITNTVTDFIARSSNQIKSSQLGFSMTIYGDTFFRKRPYDIAAATPLVDQFVVMAYDFHKSTGTPGPNFPLAEISQYGYDFTTMLSDFLKSTPPEKITITFGLFGYDWIVDDKGRPVKPAKALTTAQIRNDFFPSCDKKNCRIDRNGTTAETNITYTDDENKNHVIWFEDEQSIEKKMSILGEFGIGSISFWSFGYF